MNIHLGSIAPDSIDRHIDRALHREPDAGPPPGFARSVAARAARASVADARLERWLLRGLALVFACSALIVAVLYGEDWLAGFAALPMAAGASATAFNWLLALLACVALSWSFDRVRMAAPRR